MSELSVRSEVARIVWETSRADEGTISATGANIVADALLPLLARVRDEAITGLYHPEFGTEWREPDGSLFVAFREAQAAAWEAGYRHGRGKVDQAQIDLHNPYRREAS